MAQNAFQTLFNAAQSLPRFGQNKPYAQIHSTEQGTPLCHPAPFHGGPTPFHGGPTPFHGGPPPVHPFNPKPSPKHEALTSRFKTVRRYTKIAGICSHVFSGILSTIMETAMIFVTYKFYKTKDLNVPDQSSGPWAKDTKLWPTYMLAASSGVTTLLALCQLIALCCRGKRKAVFFSVLYSVGHVVVWIGVSATYRIAKKKDDLWGWSCGDQAKAIQKQLGSNALNFESLCNIQGGSWEVSIAEVGFKIITTGVSWYFNRKQTGLQAMLEIESYAFE